MEILDFINEDWKKELGTKEEFYKAQELEEQGEDKYKKTHSNCCDSSLNSDGMHCSECLEGCDNQLGD